MERSANFNFYLPSRDSEDIADINQISYNFMVVDENVPKKNEVVSLLEDGSAILQTMGTTPNSIATKQYVDSEMQTSVDGEYSPTSTRAQSGIAVEEALRTLDKKYEPIETITLAEDVQQISRTSEPDGRAYNFKKLAIDYRGEKSMSRVRVQGNYKYGNQTDGYNFYIVADQTRGYVEIDANDIMKFYGAGGTAAGYATPCITTGNFARIRKADGITSLIIEGTQSLYAGTVVNIYGVRA